MACIVGTVNNAGEVLTKRFSSGRNALQWEAIANGQIAEWLAEFICVVSNDVKGIALEDKAIDFLNQKLDA